LNAATRSSISSSRSSNLRSRRFRNHNTNAATTPMAMSATPAMTPADGPPLRRGPGGLKPA
jgi:hypothetical protein